VDNDDDVVHPLPTDGLVLLKSVTSMRIHRDLLFTRNDVAEFAKLYSSVPPAIKELEITGLLPDEIRDLVSKPDAKSWLIPLSGMPQSLHEVNLVADFEVPEDVAIHESFGSNMADINGLRRAASDVARRFDVCARAPAPLISPWSRSDIKSIIWLDVLVFMALSPQFHIMYLVWDSGPLPLFVTRDSVSRDE
jgi:hypothetical protein